MKKTFLFILLFIVTGSAFAQTGASEAEVGMALPVQSNIHPSMLSGRGLPGQSDTKTNTNQIRIYYWGSEDTVRNGFAQAPDYFPYQGATVSPYFQFAQVNTRMTASTPNANSSRSSAGSYIRGRILFHSMGVVFNSFRNVVDNNVSTIPNTYRIDSARVWGFQRKTSDFLTEDTIRLTAYEIDSIIVGGTQVFTFPSTNKPVQKPAIFTSELRSSVRLFEFVDVPRTFELGGTVTGNSPRPFSLVVEFFGPQEDTFFVGSAIKPGFEANQQPGFVYIVPLQNKKGVWRRPFAPNANANFNRWNVTDAPNSTTDTVGSGFWIWASPFIEAFVELDPTPTSIEKDILGSDLTALAAYPNPVLRGSDVLVPFRTNVKADVKLTVTNLLGATVYTQDIQNLVAGEHTVEVNTANFAPGVYVARMETSFGATATSRFMVK